MKFTASICNLDWLSCFQRRDQIPLTLAALTARHSESEVGSLALESEALEINKCRLLYLWVKNALKETLRHMMCWLEATAITTATTLGETQLEPKASMQYLTSSPHTQGLMQHTPKSPLEAHWCLEKWRVRLEEP